LQKRLGKFIQLKQFHFRYTKEMVYDIVQSLSNWRVDPKVSDVQNIRAALDEVGNWGVPVVVEAADIKTMASVNERGFLMFFALFIPPLEGVVPVRKTKPAPVVVATPPPPQPAAPAPAPVVDNSALEKLQKAVAKLESDKVDMRGVSAAAQQQVETLSTRVSDYEEQIRVLKALVKDHEETIRRLKGEGRDASDGHAAELRQAADKAAKLEVEVVALKERMRLQDFDGLEERYKKLIVELSATQTSLAAAQQETDKVMRQMHALELKMPLFLRQGKNTVEPPKGDVTLVFTDVEGSTVQWEWDADSMAVAIRVHNDLLRKLLQEHGGYEVKTEGDAFMCAFADPFVAVKWCLDAQEKLLEAKWPEKIYEHPKSAVVVSKKTGGTLYKGLRVRMGVHVGKPSNEEDPVTGRMDYFGPMVNRAARVESVAHGGQIVMSNDVYDRVIVQLQSTKQIPEVIDLGTFELKGLQDPTHILQVLPVSLIERKFEAIVTKEKELAAEKKKLEDQLQEMQEKNQVLAQRLSGLNSEVKSQMSEAENLLKDVQEARMLGAPPAEMVALLKDQLLKLLAGQTSTSRELQIAQLNNEEQLKAATAAAARREKLAVASVLSEKTDLESQLNNVRATLEQAKKYADQMQEERTEATSTLRSVEKKAREDRLEVMNLRVLVSELQALLQAGAGPDVALPQTTTTASGSIRLVSDARPGGPSSSGGPVRASDSGVAIEQLERAVKYEQCHSCDLAIREGQMKVEGAGKTYHEGCFACGYCGKLFNGDRFYVHNGRPAHDACRED
jgi:class 3 adenylate cyclase